MQGLLEAADEEQRVVGRGPHDEDEQDALRLPRQRDDVVDRELVDDQRRGAQPEHGAQQHGERQDRAAVDDEQDDEHHAEGHGEQDAVDAGERFGEVGDEATRPSDVGRQSGGDQGLIDARPQGIRPLDQG